MSPFQLSDAVKRHPEQKKRKRKAISRVSVLLFLPCGQVVGMKVSTLLYTRNVLTPPNHSGAIISP